MSGRISVCEICDEIRFQILYSIGNPKIQILRSKSEFPNRTHPHAIGDDTAFIAIYIAIYFISLSAGHNRKKIA